MLPDRRNRPWLRSALTGAAAAAFLGALTVTAAQEPSGRTVQPARHAPAHPHAQHRPAGADSPWAVPARSDGPAPLLGLLVVGCCGRARAVRRDTVLRRTVCSRLAGRTGRLCYLRVF